MVDMPTCQNASRRIVAIIGRSGQLARELADLAWPGDLQPHFLGRDEIDPRDAAAIRSRLTALQPAAIINAAAYTAVDLAETEPTAAARLNVELPANLAKAGEALDIPLIHVSTDYVFAGDRVAPYHETDVASPLGIYGQSKRAGEIALFGSNARLLIVRSAGLFGRHGQNFLKTMLAKAEAVGSDPVRVVDDQITCPTPTAALAHVLQQMTIDLLGGKALPPVLHFAGQPPVSWFGFTDAIFAAYAAAGGTNLPELRPIPSSDFPRPAQRPAMSALDCSLAASLGYGAPDWRSALPSLVDQLTKTRIAA